jgi:large subunit ribosomal protein L5
MAKKTDVTTAVETEKPVVKKAKVAKPAVEVTAEPKVVKAKAVKAVETKPEVEVVAPVKKEKVNKEIVKATGSRLKDRFVSEVLPALFTSLKLRSIMEVPALSKIVVNIGVGDATGNAKLLEESVRELTDITGQKPVVTKSKKSIATFKLREGQAIGTKVTLRGIRMYQFFDKLVSISLPGVRDFRGVSKNSFDGRGNYTLGIKEQLIFPEINFDRVNKVRGMDIVIVTTAQNDEQAYALLSALGMPFKQ